MMIRPWKTRKLRPLNETRSKREESPVLDTGLQIITDVIVNIPESILKVCDSFQKRLNRNEFSIVGKTSLSDGEFVLSEEYYVPRQKVSPTSVVFREDIPSEWNTVIHSHPFKSRNFSQTDIESINCNFPFSYLYSCGEFTHGTLSLRMPEYGATIQVDVAEFRIIKETVEVDTSPIEFDDAAIQRVRYPRYPQYSYWYGADEYYPWEDEEENEVVRPSKK